MKIKTIATGSSGNFYILEDVTGAKLLLECGIPIKEIKKALKFKLSGIEGCLLSHEHQDHAKAAKDLVEMGVNLYTSQGTLTAMHLHNYFARPVKALEKWETHSYSFTAFNTNHDAAEPFGFEIVSKNEGVKIVFVTDTYFVKYYFNNVDVFMVECNYMADVLQNNVEAGLVPAVLESRLNQSHMELQDTIDFINCSEHKFCTIVMPIHMSKGNLDYDFAMDEIADKTGAMVFDPVKNKTVEV